MNKIYRAIRKSAANCRSLLDGLSEVWQRGYSWEYRMFRLKEAISALVPWTSRTKLVEEVLDR